MNTPRDFARTTALILAKIPGGSLMLALMMCGLVVANGMGFGPFGDILALAVMLYLLIFMQMQTGAASSGPGYERTIRSVLYGLGSFVILFFMAEFLVSLLSGHASTDLQRMGAACLRWLGLTLLIALPLFTAGPPSANAPQPIILKPATMGTIAIIVATFTLAWRGALSKDFLAPVTASKTAFFVFTGLLAFRMWTQRDAIGQSMRQHWSLKGAMAPKKMGMDFQVHPLTPVFLCLLAAISTASHSFAGFGHIVATTALVWIYAFLFARRKMLDLYAGIAMTPKTLEAAWMTACCMALLGIANGELFGATLFGLIQQQNYEIEQMQSALTWLSAGLPAALFAAFLLERAKSKGQFSQWMQKSWLASLATTVVLFIPSMPGINLLCGRPGSPARLLCALLVWCAIMVWFFWARMDATQRPRIPVKRMAVAYAACALGGAAVVGLKRLLVTWTNPEPAMIAAAFVSAVMAWAAIKAYPALSEKLD